MTEQELYKLYAKWTGELHYWTLRELHRHVDVEFFPAPEWVLRVYSGHAEDAIMTGWYGTTVPGLKRPTGEARATIELPRPEAQPTQAELDHKFREICLAIARILEIDLGKPKLAIQGEPPDAMESEGVAVSRDAAAEPNWKKRAKQTKENHNEQSEKPAVKPQRGLAKKCPGKRPRTAR